MIFDAGTLSEGALDGRVFDVCVCGSGPAGITLARRLAAAGRSVALLEGGGLAPTPEDQALYAGDNVGLPYFPLDQSRQRCFGGTSGLWAGLCPSLETDDFSAWPIAKTDIDPFAAEASAILETRIYEKRADPLGFDGRQGLKAVAIPRSRPPVHFGTKYRLEIERAARLELFYHANLVDLDLDPDRRHVVAARAVTRDGARSLVVRARCFALCLGGIENARLLLNCTRQMPAGIGNERDLVGRHFCEHPQFAAGRLLANPARIPYFGGVPCYVADAQLKRQAQCLAFAAYLPPNDEPSDSLARVGACAADFSRRLAEAVFGRRVDCPADKAGEAAAIVVVAEQALNPDSRVGLAETRDALGLRRVRLDWRLT